MQGSHESLRQNRCHSPERPEQGAQRQQHHGHRHIEDLALDRQRHSAGVALAATVTLKVSVLGDGSQICIANEHVDAQHLRDGSRVSRQQVQTGARVQLKQPCARGSDYKECRERTCSRQSREKMPSPLVKKIWMPPMRLSRPVGQFSGSLLAIRLYLADAWTLCSWPFVKMLVSTHV